MPVGNWVSCTEDELDTVFPQYLTWAQVGTAEMGIAHMHKNMALLKTFVTSRYADNYGRMTRRVKIFEVVKGKRHLLYDLPEGSVKSESELWTKSPKKRAVVVDDDDIAEAMASIARALGS